MAIHKGGLGRGLNALISDNTYTAKPEEVISSGNIAEVEISKIEPNPNQPRTVFDEEKLNELADSIKTLGIIQPITLRKIDDEKFQIISGERRYRASKIAGLEKVPAYIRDADDNSVLELALVENIQREDLNPIEVAISYRRLVEECNISQENVSKRVGKGRTTITNFLRLLKLPDEIQAALRNKLISVGQVRPLISIEDENLQLDLFHKIYENGLSARQVEELVKNPDGYIIGNPEDNQNGENQENNQENQSENQENNQDNNQENQPKKILTKVQRPKLNDAQKQLKKDFTQKFNVPIDLKVDSKGSCKLTFNLNSQEDYDKIINLLNGIQL